MKFRIVEHKDGTFYIQYKYLFWPFWVNQRTPSPCRSFLPWRRKEIARFASMAEAVCARDGLKERSGRKNLKVKVYSCSGDELSG